MPKKFQFPVWMVGTPEQQAAERERQTLAMAVHTRAKMTEAERLVGRGKLLEDTARQNLEEAGKDKEKQAFHKAQLADALAMQGKYQDAAKIHPDRHRKQYFRDIKKAIERPDEQKCRCKDKRAKVNDQEIAVTPRFEKARVFSPLHGDIVSLVACDSCSHLNARPLRSRLLKHNAAMEANQAVMTAERPIFIRDVQILAVNEG